MRKIQQKSHSDSDDHVSPSLNKDDTIYIFLFSDFLDGAVSTISFIVVPVYLKTKMAIILHSFSVTYSCNYNKEHETVFSIIVFIYLFTFTLLPKLIFL